MKRPTKLTIWLTLMTIFYVFLIVSYALRGKFMFDFSYPGLAPKPLGIFPIYIGKFFLQLIAVILLWMWKKLGFYTIIIMEFVSIALDLSLFGIFGAITIIIASINIGVLYYCMKPVWKKFK